MKEINRCDLVQEIWENAGVIDGLAESTTPTTDIPIKELVRINDLLCKAIEIYGKYEDKIDRSQL